MKSNGIYKNLAYAFGSHFGRVMFWLNKNGNIRIEFWYDFDFSCEKRIGIIYLSNKMISIELLIIGISLQI